MNYRQTYTRTTLSAPSGKERLEDPFKVLFLNPFAIITNCDHEACMCRSRSIAFQAAQRNLRFYTILLDSNPELRPLFKHDMAVQTKMVVSMLASLIRGLNRMPEIEGGLRELGKRHREYKSEPIHYDKVLHALLRTLEEFLGDELTPEIRQAWTATYGEIATTMIDAQEYY